MLLVMCYHVDTKIIKLDSWLDLCDAKAQAHFGFLIIVKSDLKESEYDKIIKHESVHLRQQKECFIVPFYFAYLSNYFYNVIKYGDKNRAYREVVFEKEAMRVENE